jgi:hypothetical protein
MSQAAFTQLLHAITLRTSKRKHCGLSISRRSWSCGSLDHCALYLPACGQCIIPAQRCCCLRWLAVFSPHCPPVSEQFRFSLRGRWKCQQSPDLHFWFLKRNSKCPFRNDWLSCHYLGKPKLLKVNFLVRSAFLIYFIIICLIQEVEHTFMLNSTTFFTPKVQYLVLVFNQHWYCL